MRETPKQKSRVSVPGALPNSFRYIKLGEKGRWWKASKNRGELHAGWSAVPDELIASRDYHAIETHLRQLYGSRRGATQDINMLRSLLDQPSRHVWITFEDGYLWWCTVGDNIEISSNGSTLSTGHFWLTCRDRWSNESLGGRSLEMANLPGGVTATAGYRATTCEPAAANQILRLIRDEVDPEVLRARDALREYRLSVALLVQRLGQKDFELLVDLLLSRSGWVRVAKLGGATEGIDIEAENPATSEVAFVQVKSTANQKTLDDYVQRFSDRRDRYDRMIFAVHSTHAELTSPAGIPVQVWTVEDVSRLAVRLGLAEWIAGRI